MQDFKSVVSVINQILSKSFYVFGYRITLLSVIIGTAVLGLVSYFIFGLFEGD